jgi:hypothetical protein
VAPGSVVIGYLLGCGAGYCCGRILLGYDAIWCRIPSGLKMTFVFKNTGQKLYDSLMLLEKDGV